MWTLDLLELPVQTCPQGNGSRKRGIAFAAAPAAPAAPARAPAGAVLTGSGESATATAAAVPAVTTAIPAAARTAILLRPPMRTTLH
ncbi:hypothetical protein GCM10009678_79870 [Actinomadura kijaniata]